MRLPFICFLIGLLISGCARHTEATSRREQEAMFRELVGFAPSSAVADIKYTDVYNRNLMDAVYAQWLRFTYVPADFEHLLRSKPFHLVPTSFSYGDLYDKPRSAWWPEVHQTKIQLYVFEKHVTPSDSASCREYVWCDKTSGFVYLHRRFWD